MSTPLIRKLRYFAGVEFGGYAAHEACVAMGAAADELEKLLAPTVACDGMSACPLGRERGHYDRDTGRLECDLCPGEPADN